MSGAAHRNADKINTIGIVVVGICGAVLVYVSIVALQAFYVNDTSELQNTADYGGNDTPVKQVKSEQLANIGQYGLNPGTAGTYHLKIADAEALIVKSAPGPDGTWPNGAAPGTWVPAIGPAATPTSLPIFGRGHPIVGGAGSAAPANGSDAGSAPAAGSDAGSAAPAGGGSAGSAAAAPAAGSAAPAAGSAAAGGHAP